MTLLYHMVDKHWRGEYHPGLKELGTNSHLALHNFCVVIFVWKHHDSVTSVYHQVVFNGRYGCSIFHVVTITGGRGLLFSLKLALFVLLSSFC